MHVEAITMSTRTVSFALFSLLATIGGCERRQTDNPDVAAAYRHNKYDGDIVTGTYRDETSDQGQGVKPETLIAIDDRITNVYGADFRHCLESEMDDHDARFMRAAFKLEFTVEPDGHAHDAHVLQIGLSQQDAKGHDVGVVAPEHLGKCIVAAVDDWEFDPAPEVAFVDTYEGKLAEAY